MIEISKILHRDQERLKLVFPFDRNLIARVKQLEGAAWSRTHKAWHLPFSADALDAIIKQIGIENLKLLPEVQQLQQTNDSKPEADVAQRNVRIILINNKIRIHLPKDERDIKFIRALRYSRWLPKDFCWEVPDYPGNIDLIKDHFGDRIASLSQVETMDVKAEAFQKPSIKRSEVLLLKTRSGRVKVFAFFNKALIDAIKQLPYSRWDAKNKWWTFPYSKPFIEKLKAVCKANHLELIYNEEPKGGIAAKKISPYDVPNYRKVPDSYIQKHIELRNSEHTVRNYVSAFEEFINYFHHMEIDRISEPQILEYLRYLVSERQVSVSYQNVAINAIKFYYEKVLGGQRKFYFISRPTRDKVLPDVLNTQEITSMIKVTDNIKHKLIIMIGYGSGLRLNEINRVRLADIDRERMQLRVKQGKGRKDRYTKLAAKILPVLDAYIEKHHPVDLLFTGATGGLYSDRSIQQVVKKAAFRAGITKTVTTKTLRHSFATHLLEHGVELRYIQEMMGHSSIKTTQIYTHITTKGFDEIKSPMDGLDI